MILGAVVLLAKAAAFSFAGYDSLEARFLPGIVGVAAALYLTLARLASLLPPYPDRPLRNALADAWWVYPTIVFVLSFVPMVLAFRTARGLREDDPRHRLTDRIGFAFLACVLIDLAILVLGGVGALLLARAA